MAKNKRKKQKKGKKITAEVKPVPSKKKLKIPIKKKPPTGSVGDIGISTPTDEEILSELSPPDGLKKFRNMRDNDPIIGGMYIRVEQILKTASYVIEGPNKGLVTTQLDELPSGINGLVGDIASAFLFGFYLGELIWEYGDGGVVLTDIEPRYQITITDFTTNTKYASWDGSIKTKKYAVQQTDRVNVDIPLDKCLHYVPLPRCRNPYGISFLRHLYKPYYYKSSVEAAEALSIDRDLGGLPHLSAPEGFDFVRADEDSPSYDPYIAATLEWAEDVVGAIRKDELQGLVTPAGWEFNIVRGDTRTTMPTTEVISRYNSEIAIGFLQLFAVMGGFANTNNANVEEMVMDFQLACDAFLTSIAEAINKQVINKICYYNGKASAPKLKFDKLKRTDLADLAGYIARLVDKGVIDPTVTIEKALLRKVNIEYTTHDKKEIKEDENDNNGGDGESDESDEMINKNKSKSNNKNN